MAKARRIKQTIVKREKVDRIQLTLTEGEADFLQAVLAFVQDTENNSPSKYSHRISSALESATGQRFWETDACPLAYTECGALRFREYPAGHEVAECALNELSRKLDGDLYDCQ